MLNAKQVLKTLILFLIYLPMGYAAGASQIDKEAVAKLLAEDKKIDLSKVSVEEILPSIARLVNRSRGLHGVQYISKGRKRPVREKSCNVSAFSNWQDHLNMDVVFHEGYYQAKEGPLEGFHFPQDPVSKNLLVHNSTDDNAPGYSVTITKDTIKVSDHRFTEDEIVLQFSSSTMTRDNLVSVTFYEDGLLNIKNTCVFALDNPETAHRLIEN